MEIRRGFKGNILILVIPFIILLISFFLMKYLFSIDNIFLSYIACIINIIFDVSLGIFGFIFVIDIVFLLDHLKDNSKGNIKE